MAQEISENLLKVIKELKKTETEGLENPSVSNIKTKQTYKESLKNKSWNLKHSSKFKIPTVSELKFKKL